MLIKSGPQSVRLNCIFTSHTISTQNREGPTIVCWLFRLTLFLPVVSSCDSTGPWELRKCARLTGLVALQSVLSSERRSLTYPKSACFQKISRAVSSECVLTGQEIKKDQIILSDARLKMNKKRMNKLRNSTSQSPLWCKLDSWSASRGHSSSHNPNIQTDPAVHPVVNARQKVTSN